jgi:hypothetical protein
VENANEKARWLPGVILKIQPEATASSAQWELSLLFPNRTEPVQ